MLEITFGDIAYGCAKTYLNTRNERIEVNISFFSDPFEDLAILALAMLRGEAETMMRFTDEPAEYRLISKRTETAYTLRLEQWTDWFSLPPGLNKLEKICLVVTDIDPKTFALQICIQLQLIERLPGVMHWFLNEEADSQSTKVRANRIAELEKSLLE